ncbi:hypothetical protein PENTCL1PPCAC_11784 [Pristionchus entomophagus]|uniref:Protein-tyrosine phosphatase catalytic domain-containing protein n=1 Tax=Pristionchus entomophagus TaxID=358040 RepID=A0AAV5TB68_9BILA|nr:hypothetical protein PENTCL1PPCAC_11784 [Pristionchus entomophagus]
MYVPNYYFPIMSGEKITIGTYTVTHQGTTNVRGVYNATVLLVTKGNESRRIVHFDYFDWPRKCTPRHPSENSDSRSLQYWSRWISFALDILCEKMDKSHSEGKCVIDVADTVTRLRTQRSMAVQRPEEFVFLNLVTLEYALRKKYFTSEDVAKLHMSNYYLFPEPETDAIEN